MCNTYPHVFVIVFACGNIISCNTLQFALDRSSYASCCYIEPNFSDSASILRCFRSIPNTGHGCKLSQELGWQFSRLGSQPENTKKVSRTKSRSSYHICVGSKADSRTHHTDKHCGADILRCHLCQKFEHHLSTFGIICDFFTYMRATDNDVRLLQFKMTNTQCSTFGAFAPSFKQRSKHDFPKQQMLCS